MIKLLNINLLTGEVRVGREKSSFSGKSQMALSVYCNMFTRSSGIDYFSYSSHCIEIRQWQFSNQFMVLIIILRRNCDRLRYFFFLILLRRLASRTNFWDTFCFVVWYLEQSAHRIYIPTHTHKCRKKETNIDRQEKEKERWTGRRREWNSCVSYCFSSQKESSTWMQVKYLPRVVDLFCLTYRYWLFINFAI